MRRLFCVGILFAIAALLVGRPAVAVITRLTPLREVLAAEQFIFVAKVISIDPQKPAVVLSVAEDLKGKIACRKLPVNMTGDSEAQKAKQAPQLFKRLAPELPVVVFSSQRGKRYTAFVFTNGTWFQLSGQADADPAVVRWSLVHAEPYLRRTFKGTTAELRQIIIDGLAKKKQPPEPDPKAEPGLGPELKAKDEHGAASGTPLFSLSRHQPVFAVIPTAFIMGPLALLATLFPAVFGGFQRRWLVLLSTVSTNSTLFVLYFLFRGYVKDHWWGSVLLLWAAMTMIALAGTYWAWRRVRAARQVGESEVLLPRDGEELVLRLLAYLGLGVLLYGWGKGVLSQPTWRDALVLWSVVWVGAAYARFLRWRGRRAKIQPALSVEGVMLGALVVVCAGLGAANVRHAPGAIIETVAIGESITNDAEARGALPQPLGVAWSFEPADRGTIDSTPLVRGDRVFTAASHRAGFSAFGAVYCLERGTGKQVWKFDDDGAMKPVFSSPYLADGKLYIGEGYHQDARCKLYCLDAATGAKQWEFQTESHTESSPVVASGKVYFGAGDDGVYCLDAASGKKRWQFTGPHVDTSPAVVGNRLFAGSGYGSYEVFCLDTATGDPVWRVPLDLPAFGAPATAGSAVIFGIGNGNLLESANKPAGAVVCLDAATGQQRWRYDVADAVHARPAVDERHVYFASRDHHVYCVGQTDGRLIWKQDIGSPVVADPALARCSCCGQSRSLFAVGSGGNVVCLDPHNGTVAWSLDLQKHGQGKPQVLSSPVVLTAADDGGERREIYFGAGLDNLVTWTAKVYCLKDVIAAEQR